METYVGLLRAVNVGGNPLAMATLRGFLEREGLEEVQTLLQSGNVVFRSENDDPGRLGRHLEERLARALDLRTDFLLRRASEWKAIVQRNPFPKEAETAPNLLVVTTLKAAPGPSNWKALADAVSGPERVHGAGREAYIVYPDGQGRSRLTLSVIERHLGTRGTSRNWNTVTKLDRLASPASS